MYDGCMSLSNGCRWDDMYFFFYCGELTLLCTPTAHKGCIYLTLGK